MTLPDRAFFDNSPIPFWEEDFSEVAKVFKELSAKGVTDFRDYFEDHPEEVVRIAGLIRVVDINQASCEMFGLENKEELSKSIHDYFTDESFNIFTEEIIALANGESHFEGLIPIKHPNGEVLFLEIRLSVVDGFENLSRVIVSFIDVTQRELAEQSLVHSRYELEESNKTKSRLFSIVAHDLINPMQAIAGFSDILANDDDVTEQETKEFSEILDETSKGTLRLLMNLLSWSKIQLNKIQTNPVNVELRKLVDDAVSAYTPLAGRKNIETKLPKDATLVFADADLIRTVISNLYHNAVKFTPKNGIVALDIFVQEESVELRISDSGVGMSAAQMNRINSATRGISTIGTEEEKGSGLGLMVCKDFLRMHGSELKLSSELSKGTTFSFSLPLGKEVKKCDTQTNPSQ